MEELNEEKEKNNKLSNELKKEKEEINKSTNELNIKKEKINNLAKEINKEKEKNNNLKNQLDLYKTNTEQLNSKIISLQSDLYIKITEIQNLNNKINILSPNNLNYINQGEIIMAINFISTDQKVNYALPCKNKDVFVKLEEKLYNEFPEYKDMNVYFTVRGNTIKRFKTLEENEIKSSDIIILNIYE